MVYALSACRGVSPDDSCPASTEPNPRMGRVAPPIQTKEQAAKIKTERRAEWLLAPTVYVLPGQLPPTPVPAKEPETTRATPLSSDNSEDFSDDSKPLTEGQRTEALHQCHVFQELRPGPIPDKLGVVLINQNYEHNNFFHGMVACHFYLLPRTNMVYSGVTAIATSEAEHVGRNFLPPSHWCLYAVMH